MFEDVDFLKLFRTIKKYLEFFCKILLKIFVNNEIYVFLFKKKKILDLRIKISNAQSMEFIAIRLG